MTTRQNTTETIRDEGVNIHLAQLLSNRGISEKAERRSRAGVTDVNVDSRVGDQLVLEHKWEEASGLLQSQLDAGLAAFSGSLGIVGILYPDRRQEEDDPQASPKAATDLRLCVPGTQGNSTAGPRVRTGRKGKLGDNLRTLALELEAVDQVAAAADVEGYTFKQAAERVVRCAHISRRLADIITNTGPEKDRSASVSIGCLVPFDTLARRNCLTVADDDVQTIRAGSGQPTPDLRREQGLIQPQTVESWVQQNR